MSPRAPAAPAHERRALLPATLYSGKYNEMDFNQVNDWAPINIGLLRSVDAQFARAFAPSLVDALPGDWTECDWVKDCANVTSVLVLLARVVSTGLGDAELRKTVARMLCKVVRRQRPGDITRARSYENLRFPVVCLFDCVTSCPDVFLPEGTLRRPACTCRRSPSYLTDLTTFMSISSNACPFSAP